MEILLIGEKKYSLVPLFQQFGGIFSMIYCISYNILSKLGVGKNNNLFISKVCQKTVANLVKPEKDNV